jgi:hypothetical protein
MTYFVLFLKYEGDDIKEDEMDRACSMHGEKERDTAF